MAVYRGFLLLLLLLPVAMGYKPVIFMHGIFASYKEFDTMHTWIQQKHPGTETHAIDAYNNLLSLEKMWTQVEKIQGTVSAIMQKHPEGVHLICYSQGGLICRGLLSTLKHNVDTFIALSSPLAGQFGDTQYLRYLFPNHLRDALYRVLYTKDGQDLSIGNYWNDPHHQDLYREIAAYLPVLNNETFHPHSQEFRSNFLRLKKLVLVGGPHDGVITPWQSSQFGVFNKDLVAEPMEKQPWYINDSFGLRTLDKTGRIDRHVVPGVQHLHWYNNATIFGEYVLPYLT